jgi:hypothetical protein
LNRRIASNIIDAMRGLLWLAIITMVSVAYAQDDSYYKLPNEPWADKVGRIRYGPQGIPAPEYHRLKMEQDRTEAERTSREREKAFQEWSKSNKPRNEESKGVYGTPKIHESELHRGSMAWSWSNLPKE